MSRSILPALVTVVALLPAVSRSDEWKRSYPNAVRPSVYLRTFDGSVDVSTWDQNEVSVHVVADGWRIGSRGGLRVLQQREGDRIEVEVREPAFEFRFGLRSRSIRVQVQVPNDVDLTIKTGDGPVSVEPLSGRVEVATGDGSIHVEGVRGDVRLRTGDGIVQANGIEGRLDVQTGDGPVRVEGRFDGLSLRSRDGTITAESEHGSTLGKGWEIHTGDGNIVLRIGSDLRADLDARTEDGEVRLELPITLARGTRRGTLQGSLNGGGPPLRAHSGNGSIQIEKL